MSFVDKLRQFPNLVSYGKADLKAIEAAENTLDLCFAPEYKEYLSEFGAASVEGYEFTGLVDLKFLNVVDVTSRLRKNNPSLDKMYVVEEVHVDGLVIWQDEAGQVYQTIPGSLPQKIANTLSEYLDV